MSGAMQSKVGNSQIYEANEQRPDPNSGGPAPLEAGKPNAHGHLDSKDGRSHGVTAAVAAKLEKEADKAEQERDRNPLHPAEKHGNEPSKGAKIDAEIMQDEDEELRRKGKA